MPPVTRAPEASPEWAWAPYQPEAARPWDLRLAAHLFRRAGFGARWAELQQALGDGPQRTVDRLMRPEGAAAFNEKFDGYEAGAIDPGGGSMEALREWWLRRMMETPHPLLEKMTLFWHGYFAVNGTKVGSARLVQQHVDRLRAHALGKFGALLEAISRDAALLVTYNGDANRRARPSEGFARRLMDLFGLGPEEYTEADLREVARAFTGWFVVKNRLRFLEHEHDPGPKRILGQEGQWKADDVVRIALRQSAVPRVVVRKLYRWLVSETDEPADELLAPLAEAFAKDYDVSRLVETVLRSNLFFSPVAYRRRIKSPIEFALGIVRGLEAIVPTRPLEHAMGALGQQIGSPPTVKGWEGGRAWINSFTWIGRSNLALALVSPGEPYGGRLDPAGVARKHGHARADAAAKFLLDLFLQGDLEESVRRSLIDGVTGGPDGLRRLAHLIVTLPEFQLG